MSILIPEMLHRTIEKNSNVCALKDLNSVFIAANTTYAHLVGFKDHKDFIGLTDFDLPCKAAQCAPLFRAQDQEILTSQRKMRVLDIHPFAKDEWKAFIVKKVPYFTSDGVCQGIFLQGGEITHSSILELGALLTKTTSDSDVNPLLGQNSYLLGAMAHPISLSSRQKEVLFFLIRGHSLKHIAATLNVTISTISEHVDKLKEKFNTATKNDLIEKAITQGFFSFIPDTLKVQQISLALKEFSES